MTIVVRPATLGDAAACAAIYAPYVRETSISFEAEPPDETQIAQRITDAIAWLVAVDTESGAVIGYAYAVPHGTRAAYRWTVTVSVYVDRDQRRGGVGQALYGELLPLLGDLGYRRAVAGVTLPNDASLGFHRSRGFVDQGVLERVGWKFDTWHSVATLARDLGDNPTDPPQAPQPQPPVV